MQFINQQAKTMKGQFKYMEKRLNDLESTMEKIKDVEMS
jgi:hypothetical protein